MERNVGLTLILLAGLVVVSTGTASAYHNLDSDNADSPPDTECTENPGPACQEPNFADNKDRYFYDLDVSWVFSGQAEPTDDGPSIFVGKGAGSLKNDLTSDSGGSGASVTEYFIQNTGAAGTNSFAQGSLENKNIEIPSARTVSGENGDRLVNPPHKDDCGDGIQRDIETPTDCQPDAGTPKEIVLTDEPEPRRNNEYTEPSGDDSINIASERWEKTYYGDKSDNDKDYFVDNQKIREEEITGENNTLISGTANFAGKNEWDSQGTYATSNDKQETACKGSKCGGRDVEICNEFENLEESEGQGRRWRNVDNEEENTVSASTTTYKYDPDDGGKTSQELDVEVTYPSSADMGTEYGRQKDCDTYKDYCIEEYETTSDDECKEIEEDHYPQVTVQAEVTFYTNQTRDWKVQYEDFSEDRQDVWGPVNDQPSMFNNYYSNVDVKNSENGYHSDISSIDNDRTGSNDPAVSFNQYKLEAAANNFEANRNLSNTADADGPNGQGDGMIAYLQTTGITGKDSTAFEQEHWNGEQKDYFSQEAPFNSCPEDSIRCVASVDISTKQQGWSNEPENSYKVE